MAKLADALALGASGVIHGGSTPPLPTEVLRDGETHVGSQPEADALIAQSSSVPTNHIL
jgi:hypothetical protein